MPVLKIRDSGRSRIELVIESLLKRCKRSALTGCLEWQGTINKRGYGSVTIGGVRWLTHRLMWALTYGEVPADKMVLHKCDNRRCCAVEHLFLGTHEDNMEDMVKKGRAATGDRNGARMYPERLARGTHNGAAKLTREKVRGIRRLRKLEHLSYSRLAKIFGVSVPLVGRIVRGEIWQDDIEPD